MSEQKPMIESGRRRIIQMKIIFDYHRRQFFKVRETTRYPIEIFSNHFNICISISFTLENDVSIEKKIKINYLWMIK
jgi:hypothetical protein